MSWIRPLPGDATGDAAWSAEAAVSTEGPGADIETQSASACLGGAGQDPGALELREEESSEQDVDSAQARCLGGAEQDPGVSRHECADESFEPGGDSAQAAAGAPNDSLNARNVTDRKRQRHKGGTGWCGQDARNPYEGIVSEKYWAQRFRFFSLFERGVKLDAESWYSVTPEIISQQMAERCSCGLLFDPFCGVGGNAIQAAKTCHQVIAMDIDPSKVEMARHNARIYGVGHRIEFVVGDAIATLRAMPAGAVDAVLLSPPWGGSGYTDVEVYDIKTMISVSCGRSTSPGDCCDGEELLRLARKVTKNVAYFLPRNVSPDALGILVAQSSSSAHGNFPLDEICEVQDQILNNKLKSRVAYYGSLAEPPSGSQVTNQLEAAQDE